MTIHQPPRVSRRLAHSLGLPFAVLLAAVVIGCSSVGASGSPSTAPSASPPPASASPSSGTLSAAPSSSAASGIEPTGTLVKPRPGQIGVHAISASSLSAAVDGHRLVVTINFWSGVEPCSILDSIQVQRGAGSYAITLREGRGPEEVVCDMLAVAKRAIVDLGDLEPGSYTISDATGGASAITVTIT